MYTFRSKYIAVEAPLVPGNQFVLKLSKRYHARPILEVVEENPLSYFYDDIKIMPFEPRFSFIKPL